MRRCTCSAAARGTSTMRTRCGWRLMDGTTRHYARHTRTRTRPDKAGRPRSSCRHVISGYRTGRGSDNRGAASGAKPPQRLDHPHASATAPLILPRSPRSWSNPASRRARRSTGAALNAGRLGGRVVETDYSARCPVGTSLTNRRDGGEGGARMAGKPKSEQARSPPRPSAHPADATENRKARRSPPRAMMAINMERKRRSSLGCLPRSTTKGFRPNLRARCAGVRC